VAKRVSVINLKGGVGKMTLTLTLVANSMPTVGASPWAASCGVKTIPAAAEAQDWFAHKLFIVTTIRAELGPDSFLSFSWDGSFCYSRIDA